MYPSFLDALGASRYENADPATHADRETNRRIRGLLNSAADLAAREPRPRVLSLKTVGQR